MLKFISGGLIGVVISIIWLCILYHSKIQRDWGFWFSDIIGIVSAIIIGFYMPRKLSQALNNKKDKKQYLLDSISIIEDTINDFVDNIESYCCPQEGTKIDKDIAVNISLHKMEILWNKITRIKKLNDEMLILKSSVFEELFNNFSKFRNLSDEFRNNGFNFDYTYLRLFVTDSETKLLSKLHDIKLSILNKN